MDVPATPVKKLRLTRESRESSPLSSRLHKHKSSEQYYLELNTNPHHESCDVQLTAIKSATCESKQYTSIRPSTRRTTYYSSIGNLQSDESRQRQPITHEAIQKSMLWSLLTVKSKICLLNRMRIPSTVGCL